MTARHVLGGVEVVDERGLEDPPELSERSTLPDRRRAAEREEDASTVLHKLRDPRARRHRAADLQHARLRPPRDVGRRQLCAHAASSIRSSEHFEHESTRAPERK